MTWWGKLIGGAFGLMIGGPIGALLGVALGHSFDRGLHQSLEYEAGADDEDKTKTAFFAATFSVMGHLAKADGQVSEDEIDMARQVMAHMQLSEDQKRVAIRLFNEGKASDFPLELVLTQLKRECHHRATLLQMFLEIQIATVMADGVVHEQEQKLLSRVGIFLGFEPEMISRLISMVQAQSYSYRFDQAATPAADDLDKAYQALGVGRHCDDAELKKAYRRLMNQHHPDKLVSRGMPEEMVKLATEKTQEIKTAYELIKKSRGLK